MKVSRFLVGLAMVVGLAVLCMPEINEGQRRGKRGDKSAASKPAPESTATPVPEPDMKMPGSGKMQMVEKESKKAARSTLVAEGGTEIRLELKGYNGPVTIDPVVESGSYVEAGAMIAVFNAEKYDEIYEDAQMALERAERLYELNAVAAERTHAGLEMKARKAELAAEKADADWMEFQEFGYPAAIERQEIKLASTRAKIQEMEDEINQLEALYSKNEIAKESEQVVLNRAHSRLELMKRGFALDEHDFEYLKSVTLPMREREMALNVENAKLALEHAGAAYMDYDLQARAEEIKYELAVIAAQRRISNLEEDQQYISVGAPHSGYIFFGGVGKGDFGAYETGDSIKNGAIIATITPLETYSATIQVPVAELEGFQAGDVITVTCKELAIDLDAQIVQRARFAAGGKVALKLMIEDLDAVLMPGLTIAPASHSHESNE